MSHTVNIDIKMDDMTALKAACKRLGLTMKDGTHKLYGSTETGIGINLKGWTYPVVLKKDGTVSYDNYNGSWGKQKELDALKQIYGVEKAKKEARKKGYMVSEKKNAKTGEIKLTINL